MRGKIAPNDTAIKERVEIKLGRKIHNIYLNSLLRSSAAHLLAAAYVIASITNVVHKINFIFK